MNLPDGVVRTAMGIYVLQDDTCLSRWVETAMTLEIPMNLRDISAFAQYLPPGAVAVDAGACIGDHTVTYSQLVGSEGRIYAFEPHPVTYEALALNTARLKNVETFHAALSDHVGDAYLHRHPNIGASFLAHDGERVDCLTLDTALAELRRCDFVHLDAEGWEPRILRGGQQLIQKFRPVLVVEVCNGQLHRAGSSEAELLALLSEMGYDAQKIQTEAALHDVLCLPRAA